MEKLFESLVKAIWEGLKHLPYRSTYLWASLVNTISVAFILAYRPPNIIVSYINTHHWPLWIQRHFALPEYAKSRVITYLILTLIFYSLIVGGILKMRLKPYQNKLDLLKLGGEENRPRIISLKRDDDLKTIIRVKSMGIGVEKFQTRKGDIQAAFNQNVESILANENAPQYIEIILSRFPLPKLVYFDAHSDLLQEEGQFIIGQSRQGVIVQKIGELPHLLMAGTTGSGKSTFFKQALLGLMQSSPKAIFYLIDLKRGAEFRVFSIIPGVKFAKTIPSALDLLRAAKSELMTRLDQLDAEGITKIDPKTHQTPRLIIAIDEASEILAIPHRNSPDKEDIMESRAIVNDIAKLGRAAAVNLIVATQKVSKTIIDTSLQENMGGRLAFRMATLANSAQVLGSKDARDIPAIEGRGRYQFGTKSLDIQAPFLTDEQLKYKLKSVAELRAQFISNTREITSLPKKSIDSHLDKTLTTKESEVKT